MIRTLCGNKIFWYLSSRYLTFFLQFVTSLYVAVKLGPYYFGVWSFFLLLVNILQYCNLGIGNAINVFLVQYKNDERVSRNYIVNGQHWIGLVCLLPIGVLLYDRLFGIEVFEKYHLGNFVYLVCGIVILQHWNNFALNVFRVKNKLFQVAFFQSSFPAAVFLLMFWRDGKTLLLLLGFGYLAANLLSALLYACGRAIPPPGRPDVKIMGEIFRKGIFLFFCNVCFYFIILTTKSTISYLYPVEEFGQFAFAYNLAQAAVMLLESMIFLLFPKMLDMFHSEDLKALRSRITFVNDVYVTITHAFGYLTIAGAYLLLLFFPLYRDSFFTLTFIVLSLMIYKNSLAYSSYMMAKNLEKTLALIAAAALLLNIALSIYLCGVLRVSVSYAVSGMLFSYFIYCSAIMLYVFRKLEISSLGEQITLMFPLRLVLPFLSALLLTCLRSPFVLGIPLGLFICMNIPFLMKSITCAFQLLRNPDKIDIKRS